MLMHIKKGNGQPVYRQIIDGIIKMIDEGTLKPDAIVPSSREFAGKMGVNRTTVYKAYEELISLGYLISTPGSYTRVRRRIKLAEVKNENVDSGIDWSQLAKDSNHLLYERYLESENQIKISDPDIIDFSRLEPDPRLFPLEEFRKCFNKTIDIHGAKIFRYGDPQGFPPLREYIAKRMKTHGVAAEAENILITNGSQQALDLMLRTFGLGKNKIAIECPTYHNFVSLMMEHSIEPVNIPMRNDGADLDVLEKELENQQISMFYTIPNFHNPTGISTSQEHRERLISICEKHSCIVLEDGFEEEMKYFGKTVLPVKSIDHNQVVVYLGTFSKVLFPGIRLGWLVADTECIQRLIAVRRCTDLSVNNVLQAVLELFCYKGHYDLHLRRLHRSYRKRMQATLDQLEQSMPAGVNWTTPDGGYLLGLTLDQPVDDIKMFQEILIKHKVKVPFSNLSFFNPYPLNHLRLSVALVGEDNVREGIIRLGEALKEVFDHVSQ